MDAKNLWLMCQSGMVTCNPISLGHVSIVSNIDEDKIAETEKDINRMEEIWDAEKGTPEYYELDVLLRKYE